MSIRDFKTVEERRIFIENLKKLKLNAIGVYSKGLTNAQFTNCENMIGATQIPLGIAGPLAIKGNWAKDDFYIPLATTEAALVASVNRGCKAISLSGGAIMSVEDVGVTRGPVFKTSGILQSLEFKSWIGKHFNALNQCSKKTSSHLTLLKADTQMIGRYVFVRFYFNTGEAMGMNMTTIAATSMCEFIERETKIKCISEAGNFDIDKKPAWLNIISGRGKKVWAEATIGADILRKVLKTTAQDIYNVWLAKCMLGSAIAGSLGFNAHFANIIAAIFLSTGQDIAHTVEGSLGVTTTEVIDSNLYISVYLPDLMIGTVGGGTKLASQKEALSILGIFGAKNSSLKLAEICGATVLAGEISLLASLAERSLASAHKSLTRRKMK